MKTKTLSLDLLERTLGTLDPEDREESSNQADLRAAKAALRRAMERELTGRQLECVRLYYFSQLTQEQIARTLCIGRPTVCRHLQKARARLKHAVSYVLPTRD